MWHRRTLYMLYAFHRTAGEVARAAPAAGRRVRNRHADLQPGSVTTTNSSDGSPRSGVHPRRRQRHPAPRVVDAADPKRQARTRRRCRHARRRRRRSRARPSTGPCGSNSTSLGEASTATRSVNRASVAESTQFASFSVSECSKDAGYSRREPSIMSNVSLAGARARATASQMRTSIARRAYGGRSREKPAGAHVDRAVQRARVGGAARRASMGQREAPRADRLVHFRVRPPFVWMSLEVVLVYLSFMIAFYITFFGREMYNFLLRLDGGRVTMQTKCAGCRGKEDEEIELAGRGRRRSCTTKSSTARPTSTTCARIRRLGARRSRASRRSTWRCCCSSSRRLRWSSSSRCASCTTTPSRSR